MRESFYPRPSSPIPFESVGPREVLALSDPPPSLLLHPPVLPPEAQARIKDHKYSMLNNFVLSTHIIPAAYPRVTLFVALQSRTDAELARPDSSTLSKEERKEKATKVTEELLRLKTCQMNSTFPPDESEDRILWHCVNRYYRKSHARSNGTRTGQTKRESITLLLTHANGLPKEIWEPFLRHLISSIERSTDNGSMSVDEIWAFEETQHGDSALINEGKLSAIYDWSDYSRDILNFLTRYLPSREAAFSSDLPVHLQRVVKDDESRRLQSGFSDEQRTLVAVGHSLGGAAVTLTALTAPSIFTALILIDPTIVPPYTTCGPNGYNMALGAIQRRHSWPSREEAKRHFASSPFFAAWDPEALDNYVQFGLTPVFQSSQAVKLKMPSVQEAVNCVEPRFSFEIFERLKDLDPCIAVHWIMAGKGSWITGSEAATRDLVWRRPVNSTNTQVDSEHLIVQQVPKDLAREVHTCLEWLFAEKQNGKARL